MAVVAILLLLEEVEDRQLKAEVAWRLLVQAEQVVPMEVAEVQQLPEEAAGRQLVVEQALNLLFQAAEPTRALTLA